MKMHKAVPLNVFVDSFKDEDNPTGIYKALTELKARGVVLSYMTLSRWLFKESKPMRVWCETLARAGVDAFYLRDLGVKKKCGPGQVSIGRDRRGRVAGFTPDPAALR